MTVLWLRQDLNGSILDVGGGGTIAYISAAYAMNVVDAGVAVLNMHAPMEVTSKADIFEARNAYMAFLKA